MRFQRRGGRKRIVAPDGSELAPSSKPQPDGTLVKALARAWRWQKLLDEGVYTSVTEISEAESIWKSRMSAGSCAWHCLHRALWRDPGRAAQTTR